jgi:hypothetical protein
LFQRYASIVPTSTVFGKRLREGEDVFYVKIEKCFPFLVKRKTLSCDESNFFLLIGINFPLTSFPDGYQT